MNKLTVQVCQEHINRGLPRACGQCPIALALADALMAQGVVVMHDTLRVTGKTVTWVEKRETVGWRSVYAEMPFNARRFVAMFDSDRTRAQLQPFEFELEFN